MMASRSDPAGGVQVTDGSPPPREESAWSLRGLVRILSGDLLIGSSSTDTPTERDVTNALFVPPSDSRWQRGAHKAVVTLHPGSGTASSQAASDIEAGEAIRSASRSPSWSGASPVDAGPAQARGPSAVARAKVRINAPVSETSDSSSRGSAGRHRSRRHASKRDKHASRGAESSMPSDAENSVPNIADVK